MSLLEARMTACARLIEAGGATSDGLGGAASTWSEGAAFEAALTPERLGAGREADRDIAEDIYVVTVRRDVALRFHDVFRRASDGAVFRVISDGSDNATPASAGLDMRQARAERWTLPGCVAAAAGDSGGVNDE